MIDVNSDNPDLSLQTLSLISTEKKMFILLFSFFQFIDDKKEKCYVVDTH